MNEGPALIVRLCHGALHRIFGFVVGVGVGYGIREVISHRRHRAPHSFRNSAGPALTR